MIRVFAVQSAAARAKHCRANAGRSEVLGALGSLDALGALGALDGLIRPPRPARPAPAARPSASGDATTTFRSASIFAP